MYSSLENDRSLCTCSLPSVIAMNDQLRPMMHYDAKKYFLVGTVITLYMQSSVCLFINVLWMWYFLGSRLMYKEKSLHTEQRKSNLLLRLNFTKIANAKQVSRMGSTTKGFLNGVCLIFFSSDVLKCQNIIVRRELMSNICAGIQTRCTPTRGYTGQRHCKV